MALVFRVEGIKGFDSAPFRATKAVDRKARGTPPADWLVGRKDHRGGIAVPRQPRRRGLYRSALVGGGERMGGSDRFAVEGRRGR
ncbi:hypothetical protein AC480_00385 [miscellaneous Crenarchaeota group archaeon SMTZ1-55]|nr:MAG: hypothetical protein AC480_00385 [miscellaneous Crenarchaeota group archaeon SMTZ1-55]